MLFFCAKIMQMSAMKACFQIAECSLSYAKIVHFDDIGAICLWKKIACGVGSGGG